MNRVLGRMAVLLLVLLMLVAGGKRGTADTELPYGVIDIGARGFLVDKTSQAMTINDEGAILGWYYSAAEGTQYFYCTPEGQPQDFSTFGGYAEDLNNLGQVVGQSVQKVYNPLYGNYDTVAHAFIW